MSFSREFELLSSGDLLALSSAFSHYRHKSGLEVFCLENSDRENLFAINFSTPASDDTGLPHILEHCVLSGSAKYPCTDPFVELLKSSLATFLNAFTYNDRTVYPVCSCNEKDFFNLIEVYWDAVFHPLLDEEAFLREGWHYETLKNRLGNNSLLLNGIVFNEMSSAYSELESVLDRATYKYLLPGSALAFDSGGNPDKIPFLTYENFLQYYKKHYKLNNAKVLFTGNISVNDKLAFLGKLLNDEKFPQDKKTVLTETASSISFRKQRSKKIFYMPEADYSDDRQDLGSFSLAWHISKKADPVLDLAMQHLELILFGSAVAPMRKALLESELCEALLNCGYDNTYSQTLFQISVKNCLQKDFKKIEKLIYAVLNKLKKEIPREMLLNASRQLQMEQAEISSDYNIEIMEDVFAAWNYNYNPELFLTAEEHWGKFKANISENPGYLEEILDKYLLKNKHRLALELLPDPNMLEKQHKRRTKRLNKIKNTFSQEDFNNLEKKNQALQKKSLATCKTFTLPQLDLTDIAEKPDPYPLQGEYLQNEIYLQKAELFTRDLLYFHCAFDLETLPAHLYDVLPFFCNFILHIGSEKSTYAQLAERTAQNACKIQAKLDICHSVAQAGKFRKILSFSLQSLEKTAESSLALLYEHINEKLFFERDKLKELIRAYWASLSSDLQNNTNSYANIQAMKTLSEPSYLRDRWAGISHLKQAKIWRNSLDENIEEKMQLLNELAQWLKNQVPISAAFASSSKSEKVLYDFLQLFPVNSNKIVTATNPDFEIISGQKEFLMLTNEVSSFARAINAPYFYDDSSIALEIYAQLLIWGTLWQEIRLKNGAYGVYSQYSPVNGVFVLQTSEDPNPSASSEFFSKLAKNGHNKNWTEFDIKNAIIACCRSDERPYRPAWLLQKAISKHLSSYDEKMRSERRQKLLQQNLKTVQDAVQKYWHKYSEQYNDCLIGSIKQQRLLKFKEIKL